ncbi:hypothetical protein EYF80_039460 [Liparis tanakae]|uniref:Uncharacterized protein n=1 Tax=Liparis tanakae TaxID=230148 RepID=A0A4Z2GCH9_9TELE|nr:hypothetical protein EYF80_039460 [Liparis tanakae]
MNDGFNLRPPIKKTHNCGRENAANTTHNEEHAIGITQWGAISSESSTGGTSWGDRFLNDYRQGLE